MTPIKQLHVQRALLEVQQDILQEQLDMLRKEEYTALGEVITPYFEEIKSYGVDIDVHRSAVYFKALHPEKGYKEELFKIYMQENWKEEDPAFGGMELSYYTTTTKVSDSWQMNRLVLLGQVATLTYEHGDAIIAGMNAVCESFNDQYNALYKEKRIVQKDIRDIDTNITTIKRQAVSDLLHGEGIKFTKGVNVDLKYKYSPRITQIKIKEVSKSGKRATVQCILAYGEHVYTEENCILDRIIDQVFYYYKDIAEELLPQ